MTRPNPANDPVIADLCKHASDRVMVILRDTADTCQRLGMTDDIAARVLVSVLLTETACGVLSIRMSEGDFLKLAQVTYRIARETTAKKSGGK